MTTTEPGVLNKLDKFHQIFSNLVILEHFLLTDPVRDPVIDHAVLSRVCQLNVCGLCRWSGGDEKSAGEEVNMNVTCSEGCCCNPRRQWRYRWGSRSHTSDTDSGPSLPSVTLALVLSFILGRRFLPRRPVLRRSVCLLKVDRSQISGGRRSQRRIFSRQIDSTV